MNTSVAEQAVLAEFLSGGHFARHIRRTRELYRQRQADMLALGAEITPGLLEMRAAPAGMRLLGLLPRGVDARAVGWAAAERGVTVSRCRIGAPVDTDGREGLLLGYAAYEREATAAALEVLAGVVREQAAKARPERAVEMRQGA